MKNTHKGDNREIVEKTARQLFDKVWDHLLKNFEKENLQFPKEIMWLGGAPGAGKGTNTPFIMRERGITADPLVMSFLLDSPEATRLKDAGQLIGDTEVVSILFEHLLKEKYENGVVVDGFPRTQVQVECVKMLYQKMTELKKDFFDTPIGPKFRRPIFRITVLFVTEEAAIERQLGRGKTITANNAIVEKTGKGKIEELRPTDIDPAKAKERYDIFKAQSMGALESMKELFYYHLIDANGPIEEVETKIKEEFKYQSKLELGEETYDSIRNIPLASDLVMHARQELVKRLDYYRQRHSTLFSQIINIIEGQILPVIIRQAAIGHAKIRTEDHIFNQDIALSMIVDVLKERGYNATTDCSEIHIPVSINPENHAIINAVRKIWYIKIDFTSSKIRTKK